MSRPRRDRDVSLKVSKTYHVTTKVTRSLHLLVPEEASDLPEGAVPEHPDGRKNLLLDRVEVLLGSMGLELVAYCLMDNHLHLLIRTRIEEVLGWSDEEVVNRWRALHPHRDRRYRPRETTPEDQAADLSDRRFVKSCRRKLRDLSQFMKELKQHVAQEVNKLEGVPGQLWSGRFKAKPVEDVAALIEVMVYVDLNPFRAGLCPTPESGTFTSLAMRLGGRGENGEREGAAASRTHPARPASVFGGCLLPMDSGVSQRLVEEPVGGSSSGGLRVVAAGLTLPVYLRIIDGISRRIRGGRRRMDASAASLLERLEVDVEALTQRLTARCGPAPG